MKCWMMWYGGTSYAVGSRDDIESFDSLKDLTRSFDSRQFDAYYPCVSDETPDDGGPEGWIFLADPADPADHDADLYPDRIIRYGPRGGIRVESA